MKPSPPEITRLWGLWPTGDFGPFTFYTSHRRQRVVAFLKAPPKTPPSWKQKIAHTRFRDAANLWTLQPKATRDNWTNACKRAGLSITGFNLWMHCRIRNDLTPARTIQRQTGIDLGV